jgi:hypothetical protein
MTKPELKVSRFLEALLIVILTSRLTDNEIIIPALSRIEVRAKNIEVNSALTAQVIYHSDL